MLLFKYILVFALVILGLVSVRFSAQSLKPPHVYGKEFAQEYLLGRAAFEGVNPYLSLQKVAELFLGPNSDLVDWRPTPHPPPIAVLSLPLGLLTYEQAAAVWFVFEIACIFVAVYLILYWLGGRPALAFTALIALLVLGWSHVTEELVNGQLTSLLLVLLLGAWLAFRSDKPVLGGALLGCMVALKLMIWPIIVFLAFRKNWRAVGAAGAVTVIANVVAALVIGLDKILFYYSDVGFTVARLFRAYIFNFSVWSIGWRVFVGTGTSGAGGVYAPPIVSAPALAQILTYLLPLGLLVMGLCWLLGHEALMQLSA